MLPQCRVEVYGVYTLTIFSNAITHSSSYDLSIFNIFRADRQKGARILFHLRCDGTHMVAQPPFK